MSTRDINAGICSLQQVDMAEREPREQVMPRGGSAGERHDLRTNAIIRGDCLQVMSAMPNDCIDAVVTDPPYCSGGVSEASRSAAKGQGLRSENIGRFGWFVGDNMGTAGLVWLLRNTALECHRLLKSNGSLMMFCDWRMIPNIVPAVESAGFRYQNLVTWDKGHMGLGNGFRARHEQILHFTAGSPEYYAKDTGNVLLCKRVSADDREHQTQKPVELIAQLVRVVCPPGGVVLDPFAGSCTLAEACLQTGRKYICIERDPAHVATGESRIQETQPDLMTVAGVRGGSAWEHTGGPSEFSAAPSHIDEAERQAGR